MSSGADKEEEEVEKERRLPAELAAFLTTHGVPAADWQISAPKRYFRITALGRAHFDTSAEPILSVLQRSFSTAAAAASGCAVEAVEWLPEFYCMDTSVSLAASDLYSQGLVCGMDAASAAVVRYGLDLQPGDSVLDLCCAPGTKLLYMSELKSGSGLCTGVDLDKERIRITRNVLRKYRAKGVRLFCADGTSFRALAPREADSQKQDANNNDNNHDKNNNNNDNDTSNGSNNTAGKSNNSDGGNADIDAGRVEAATSSATPSHLPSARFALSESGESVVRWNLEEAENRDGRRKRHRYDLPGLWWSSSYNARMNSSALYDKVLVDAECTTDGAVLHHTKRAQVEQALRASMRERGVQRVYRTEEEVAEVVELQKRLIKRGYQLLKPGGTLVYATCSFLRQQNEDVVSWLLAQCPSASVIPFDNVESMPCRESPHLAHCLRFTPALTGGNAMFGARIAKAPLPASSENEREPEEKTKEKKRKKRKLEEAGGQ